MSQKSNDTAIERGFARLQARADELCRNAMYVALEAGVRVALQLHASDTRHLEMGDSYGWALWHNGSLVDIEVKGKDSAVMGSASEGLKLIAPPNTGWYGVVVAGMNPAHYFAMAYEEGILTNTAKEIKNNFSKYFKRI